MQAVKFKTTTGYKLIFIVITIVMSFRCVGKELVTSLTTALAFSYEYGFYDKSLVGSMYKLIAGFFTDDVYSYNVAFIFSAILMLLGIIIYIIMGNVLLAKADEARREAAFIILIFFTIFAASIITAEDYIGSAQSFLLITLLIYIYCLIVNKVSALLFVIPIIAMITDSDFALEYMSIIIVLLLYRIYTSTNKTKYKAILFVNLISTILLYIYFIISHTALYEDVIRTRAKALSSEYEVKEGLLKYYMYGFAGGMDSMPEPIICIQRIVYMILLLIPFIVFFVIMYRRVWKATISSSNRLFYRILPFGSILVIPLFIYSNNYGTWFFAMLSYYVLTTLALILMGDEHVYTAFNGIINTIKTKYKWLIILLIYAVFFTPIDSVKVGQFVNNFVIR